MALRRAVPALGAYALVAAIAFGALRAFEPVRVAGGSMHPALHAGDLVLVARAREPSQGEIALVRLPGRGPVLHRVVELSDDGTVRTQGDANSAADLDPVATAHLSGTVVGVVPVGRWVARWRGDACCATLSAQPNSARR
jgi:signal peptidase I